RQAIALEEHDILPAHVRQVVRDRATDDAPTDDNHACASRECGHGRAVYGRHGFCVCTTTRAVTPRIRWADPLALPLQLHGGMRKTAMSAFLLLGLASLGYAQPANAVDGIRGGANHHTGDDGFTTHLGREPGPGEEKLRM